MNVHAPKYLFALVASVLYLTSGMHCKETLKYNESCGIEYQEVTCGFYLIAESSVFSFLYIKLYFVFQIAFYTGYCITYSLLSVWWLHS